MYIPNILNPYTEHTMNVYAKYSVYKYSLMYMLNVYLSVFNIYAYIHA